MADYPLGLHFWARVRCADGEVRLLNGRYFTAMAWWPFLGIRPPLANDNERSGHAARRIEPAANVVPVLSIRPALLKAASTRVPVRLRSMMTLHPTNGDSLYDFLIGCLDQALAPLELAFIDYAFRHRPRRPLP